MRTGQIQNHGLKYRLKKSFFPPGLAPRKIQNGLLAGLTMELDFAHHTQRWLGLQERELFGWFRKFSRGIGTAMDVGANDGMYALYFLARTPATQVLAFEPDGQSLQLFQRNLALNGLAGSPRLEIVPKCVGATTAGAFASLDSFLPRIKQPCLVKVDIDGGEVSLLEGAAGLLRLPDTRWIVEVHSPALQEKCLEVFRAANYDPIVVRNAWWRNVLPELRPGELNQWIVATPRTSSPQ